VLFENLAVVPPTEAEAKRRKKKAKAARQKARSKLVVVVRYFRWRCCCFCGWPALQQCAGGVTDAEATGNNNNKQV
jgi:hypothetical protein